MEKWINADAVNKALYRIREEAWLHDIPSPTVPEYIEHHDSIQKIMLVIDKERKLLSDAADVAPVRRGEWVYGENEGQDGWYCSECHFFIPWDYSWYGLNNSDFIKDFHACPHCDAKMVTYTGAKMGGGDGDD